MKKTTSMFYLENQSGEVVRSIHWTTETLLVVYRFDSKRIETMTDTKDLDQRGISYEVLQTISKNVFATETQVPLRNTHLKLVADNTEETIPGRKPKIPSSNFITKRRFLANVSLTEDQFEIFERTLKKTAAVSAGLMMFLFTVNFFFPFQAPQKPELQVVHVIDRQEIKKEAPVVVAPMEKNKDVPVVKKRIQNIDRLKPRKSAKFSQRGEQGILGALTSSPQRGGLQLNQVGASRGIGNGGNQGSGGIQTAVYAKGMFSAPLGTGNRPQGAGGYGTKGKGGGQAGYGKQTLVGSAESYFEPVTSETWVQGGLDPNEIAAVIQRHESEIRACYERGLQTKPNLSGRLAMKFLIGANGRVTTASISNSSLRHPGVENCIQARLVSWAFPRPEGGVTVKVNYPFILRRVTGT